MAGVEGHKQTKGANVFFAVQSNRKNESPRQDMIVRCWRWIKTRKLIASINIAASPGEMNVLCWCLNLWESTNNGYSQLLFIYQITPDSFSIDKGCCEGVVGYEDRGGRGWILNVWVRFLQAHKVKSRRANWINFQPIQSYITNHTTQPPLSPQMLSVLRDDVIHETRPRTIEQQKITTNKKSPLRHRRGMGDIILDYMGRFSIFSFRFL